MRTPTTPATARVEPSNLTVTTISLTMADVGRSNPLPPVESELQQSYLMGAGVPEELQASTRYGGVPNVYPYLTQDSYTREATPREVTAVVLENSKLKVTVLPSLGGRIWELFDKTAGKHLLHTHHSPQVANLALRNAWFAGGLEWNIGTRGHSPTTCDPLHAAIVHTPDGKHILRLWEYERLREVVFQVDLWLPTNSEVLLAAVRIRNPNDHEVPMYWWSNAAIPETDRSRVIAPAGEAFGSDYAAAITRVRPTDHEGYDATWLVNNPHAADYFFDIEGSQRRWIVAADDDGDGLAIMSTGMLRGRKLFVWGQGPGGKRWQEWLSPGAGPYAEIQAGLAQTQFEHLAMPAGAEWAWVEAYGNGHLDPETSHGVDWDAAVAHAGERLEHLMPQAYLDEALPAALRDGDVPPSKMLSVGSGWGVVERARRRKSGRAWIDESGTPFVNESVTGEQSPWLGLLSGKEFGERPDVDEPSFVAGADWEELLASAGNQAGPEAQFHMATMKHARQELAGAMDGYRAVLADRHARARTTALAHRGLGLAMIAASLEGPDGLEGLAELAKGVEAHPSPLPLLIEAMTLCIRHGHPQDALELLEKSAGAGAAVGRLKFLKAAALAGIGDDAGAAAILRGGVEIPDLREGEDAIAHLWERVCPGEPVPENYTFGMR
ncbi:DUF5107 domain-containing protein [Arthrobacter sp. SIMBA_036]|uniref:DUF5107 domain-containing protein n=1 Tax=Arthrobacter sp. SIMBA_036 TaxID=3085778 RepID=UPI003978A644